MKIEIFFENLSNNYKNIENIEGSIFYFKNIFQLKNHCNLFVTYLDIKKNSYFLLKLIKHFFIFKNLLFILCFKYL